MVVVMENTNLEDLCDSLSELCDIPERNPGALYGIEKDENCDPHNNVSVLYRGVVKNVESFLNNKGVYPEPDLIKGFDPEQHFQQLALVSHESTGIFVPRIVFSEGQLTKINFPLCEESEKPVDEIQELADEIEEQISSESEEPGDSASESEEEDVDSEEENNSSTLEDNPNEESDYSEGEGSFKDDHSWDEVEGKEPKPKKEISNPRDLSSYERNRQKLSREIERLEDKQLQEKPWQLKGDVNAAVRPINSLLEEYLEYDITQRPAPVVTEHVTHKLEDVILKRIKDKAFDDVERKLKPVEGPPELRKKIVLDQEKSKLSLAEVYEQEFIKQKNKAKSDIDGVLPTTALPEEELTEDEKKINAGLAKLFKQLDCLTNFHYTPLPRLPEAEIVANLPAVNVEEVGPDALTSASLLAADEIAGQYKKDLKGNSEKTKTDKKRARRKKKVHQANKFNKLKLKAAATAEKTTAPGKGKFRLADPALKSSTQFFSQLETQAKKHIDSNKRQAEDEAKSKFKAKKLKL